MDCVDCPFGNGVSFTCTGGAVDNQNHNCRIIEWIVQSGNSRIILRVAWSRVLILKANQSLFFGIISCYMRVKWLVDFKSIRVFTALRNKIQKLVGDEVAFFRHVALKVSETHLFGVIELIEQLVWYNNFTATNVSLTVLVAKMRSLDSVSFSDVGAVDVVCDQCNRFAVTDKW